MPRLNMWRVQHRHRGAHCLCDAIKETVVVRWMAVHDSLFVSRTRDVAQRSAVSRHVHAVAVSDHGQVARSLSPEGMREPIPESGGKGRRENDNLLPNVNIAIAVL